MIHLYFYPDSLSSYSNCFEFLLVKTIIGIIIEIEQILWKIEYKPIMNKWRIVL